MIEICATAGWFLYPLGALALLGNLFFWERVIFLHKKQIRPESFLQGLKNLLQKSRVLEAITLCEETPGVVARLLKVGLVNLNRDSDELLWLFKQNALLELPLLRKRVESLRVMGQFASLIGLMGTVFFFLKGFWTLGSVQAYTRLTSISPYIVSALSVTFLGLCEMFAFYAAYHFLMGRIRALIFDMEWSVSEFMLFLEKYKKEAHETH